MDHTSLHDHVNGQLARLCAITGTDARTVEHLLADLLGPAGTRPRSRPPAWTSGVADDHTPVEFSLAFHRRERPTLRILAEALAAVPTPEAHLAAGHDFVRRQAALRGLSAASFDRVRDLFLPDRPQGVFALWQSLVFRRRPEFKVYFNPEVSGISRAPGLVHAALDRLGLGTSYRALIEHSVRPGELGRADRLAFFALDLHDGPHARVKLYLAHHHATAADVMRAAGAVKDIDPGELAGFCRIAGGTTGRFTALPLVGSYSFTAGSDVPVGYSLYVPIRGYVVDDDEARGRVVTLLHHYGFDSADLDRAIAAVASRRLRDGVGLIAHVSLRLGPPRPGVTVYLSAEAYRVQPRRSPCTSPAPSSPGAAGRPLRRQRA
jgi:DMATS type aromatic prenyltransferase